MKQQQIIEVLMNLLKDGFSWQETIITICILTAIVLIVLILATSITKISIALLSVVQLLFSSVRNFIYKVCHSLNNLLMTKPD